MSCFPELYFNVDNGYLEGLVRGFKAGVLRQGDYVNLVQCESLEGERGGAGPGGIPTPSRPRAEGGACSEGRAAKGRACSEGRGAEVVWGTLGLCQALLCVSRPGNLFAALRPAVRRLA